MEYFAKYLKGQHFLLYTDHKPLLKLGMAHTNVLNRLQEAMLHYDFEIVYQKGSEMPADFLSRNVVNRIQMDNKQWQQEQDNEEWIVQLRKWILNKEKPSNYVAMQFTDKYWEDKLFVENGLLWLDRLSKMSQRVFPSWFQITWPKRS